MNQDKNFHPGQRVGVIHDLGYEIGEIFSINYRTGRATIFSDNPGCPHYFDVNIFQLSSCDHESGATA